MSRDVAIIGCGPAGLLVAHAVVLADYNPVIYSIKAEPSPAPAAVFLHRAIPDVSSREPDEMIDLIKLGDSVRYSRKVYGEARPTSWGKFASGFHPAWALGPTYDALWRLYGGTIREVPVGIAALENLSDSYPLVINTAPARQFCVSPLHSFPGCRIWIRDGAPAQVQPGSMVYNGRSDPWYRASDLFGVRSTEYAREPYHFTHDHRREGLKVLDTDCDCHPTVVRAGRWGEWRSGVLLHHAFEKAQMVMNALEEHA